MPVETSVVQIAINVTDVNSGAVVAGVTQNLKQLGAAGAGVNKQLTGTAQSFTQFGYSGTIAGHLARQAMEETTKSMGEALHQTHLFTEEFGIHLPRAFQRMIAESKLAQSALSAIGPVLMGLGAVQIGGMILGQLYEAGKRFYEQWLDIDGAIERFNDAAAQAAQQKFDENRSLQQVNDDLRTASQLIDELKRKKASTGSFAQFSEGLFEGAQSIGMAPGANKGNGSIFNVADANKLNAAQGRADKDEMEREMGRHRGAVREIQDKAMLAEAGMAGISKERRARQEADSEAEENTKNKINLQKQLAGISERAGKKPGDVGYVPEPGANAYQGEERDAKAHAGAEFTAHQMAIEQQNATELRRIHEEALESGLRGNALYTAQYNAAIDELRTKQIATAGAVNDVQARFHNEQMKRLQDENREVQKMHEQTLLGGLTGVDKIQQEGRSRIDEIYRDPNPNLNPGQRLSEISDVNQDTARQIGELNKSFADRVEQIVGQSASRELGGFSKIRADAENQIRELEKSFPKGGNRAELALGVGAINTSAQGQAQELARRNADETAQIEAEAREKSLTGERQKTAAIEAEYEARFQKDEEWRRQQLAGAKANSDEIASINDNADRREAAAAQERNAEMVAASREARQKMAGEFDSLFKNLDHPLKALAGLGDKVAGEAAASLVQRLQQRSQGGAGSGGAAAPGGDIFSEIFGGNVFGGRKSTNITKSTNVTDIASGAPHAHSATTMPGRMQIASAQIEIGSATFAGGGGAPSGAGGAGASYFGSRATSSGGSVPGIAGGSTGLLAPSGSFYRPAYTGAGSAASGANWSGSGATYTASGAGGGMAYASPSSNGVYGGGAGDPTGARAATNFGGSSAASPAHKSVIGGIVGGVQQGMGLFKGAKAAFGAGGSSSGDQDQYAETQDPVLSGTLNADGSFSSSGSTNNGMLGGGGIGANAAGAMGGALGLYSAYQGGGGVGGAASGAMSGMEFGMAIGGPIGAGIGAVGGAILGAIGFGGREKARVYDLKTVRPALKNDQDSYDQGSMDYLTAFSAMQTLQNQAFAAISPMGPAARAYRNDTIDPEIKQAEAKLSAAERAGRSNYTAQAAQYDIGADSVPRDGYAMIHENERIVPSDQNERITRALENGSTMPVQQSDSGWTGDLHVHAIDARGVADFFDKHKHLMRGSLNDSYAENSGGGLA